MDETLYRQNLDIVCRQMEQGEVLSELMAATQRLCAEIHALRTQQAASSKSQFTTKECAGRLTKSEHTIRRYCRTGVLKGRKPHGAPKNAPWRIPVEEVERYEAGQPHDA